MPMSSTNQELKDNWGWFLALGIAMMIGGGAALFAPVLFSVVIEQLVGFAFAAGGIIMLVQMFTTKDGWDARMTYLILGGFTLLAGILLLFRPLEGMVALTIVLIVALFVSGLLRIAVGVMARGETGAGWVIAGGVISVLVSGYLFANYPEVSAVLLGVMAAISLIGEGAGYVRFAYGLKTDGSVSG